MSNVKKISVLYLTNNKFGVDILKDNLDRQTLQDYEVIFIDELNRHIKGWTCFKPRPSKEGCVWNLNSAYNEGIDKIQSKLTIFLQDYIWIPDDTFERFFEHYIKYSSSAIICSGGYGANKPDFKEYRSGCLMPYNLIGKEQHGLRKRHWKDFELNLAMFPTDELKKIRFEERMDRWYGGDNQILAYNASRAGMKLFIDYDIKKIGFPNYFRHKKDSSINHSYQYGIDTIIKMLYN